MTLDSTFVSVLDYLGVFVFALSGAWLAIRRDLDLVGVVTLGLVTGLAGGVVRDVLVADLPPVAVREGWLLAIAGRCMAADRWLLDRSATGRGAGDATDGR